MQVSRGGGGILLPEASQLRGALSLGLLQATPWCEEIQFALHKFSLALFRHTAHMPGDNCICLPHTPAGDRPPQGGGWALSDSLDHRHLPS